MGKGKGVSTKCEPMPRQNLISRLGGKAKSNLLKILGGAK